MRSEAVIAIAPEPITSLSAPMFGIPGTVVRVKMKVPDLLACAAAIPINCFNQRQLVR